MSSMDAFAAGPYAYLPSNLVNTISVVDLSDTAAIPGTFTVTGTEDVTDFFGVALSRKDGLLYISDNANETVFQIDTATGTTAASYFVGTNPRGIAVEPSGRHVYVAKFSSAGLSIIDTSTRQVSEVDFSPLSGLALPKPFDVALNLSGTRAYVTDSSVGHRLCRINTVAPPPSVRDGDCVEVGTDDSANPNALAVSPDGARVYVVNHSNNNVSVVDTASLAVIRTFQLGSLSPNGIAISASGKRGYVGTSLGIILVLDLTRVDDVGQNPVMQTITDDAIAAVQGVGISPDGTRLLAVDHDNGQLHVINIVGDANVRVASVPVNMGPFALGQFTTSDAIFVSGFQKSG
ncbi:MAG: YncE family protein [Dokdonella sp.]